MKKEFLETLFQAHQNKNYIPNRQAICELTESILQLLFPQIAEREFKDLESLEEYAGKLRLQLTAILKRSRQHLNGSANGIVDRFFEHLPELRSVLLKDAQAISDGDPAAQSVDQVIRTYPGFYAVALYRVAHQMHREQVPLLPRILTEHAHSKTGVDIHPGAEIGEYFCIDHGTGIVIGGTAKIGNHVKIYQGVTLGALSVDKSMASLKRHPTIGDHVVVYAGATILGGNTYIGNHSLIGGNVWLTQSVPPYAKVYHKAEVITKYHETSEDPIDFII
ncbi:MAG: serine O-acetyltransferase [Cytophagales bacterium]|nr:serine O-acetyltransferase [Cytophagales bacterium]